MRKVTAVQGGCCIPDTSNSAVHAVEWKDAPPSYIASNAVNKMRVIALCVIMKGCLCIVKLAILSVVVGL